MTDSTAPAIRPADGSDLPGLLELAAGVEHWFGPMVAEPGFHRAVRTHIDRGTALVAPAAGGALTGGLLFDPAGAPDRPHHVDWLVIAAPARGTGVGRALMAAALDRFVRPPATVDVVTFGPDHPGAVSSGARVFYERLGFVPGEAAAPGPEGGSRQLYRLRLTG
ncbi:GNAT family N-acetyltransferase [Streptomyces yaizuensis]|uniref:GNAT family N-acetyltransferase n=1 Tax=Streptomyces yaizuensis TaxID=2989713 RepID=A0ABQ5NU26_9ACTN|nr:GNAT family N-acetyltransferase [Streptomyces sp. YSPA8]GLF93699.1 GNAT family N-acetyltransferase [Streptomyces sp. YSPA8]